MVKKSSSMYITGPGVIRAVTGTIDEIIRPKETRRRIASLLGTLKDKAETHLPKKLNNIPL